MQETTMPWKNENKEHHDLGEKPKSDWGEQIDTHWNQYSEKFNQFFSNNSKKLALYAGAALGISWLASGIYIVDQGSRGVVTRFGAYESTSMPGPHWHLPMPLEDVQIVNVEKQRFIEIGYNTGSRSNGSGSVLPESLMLTKDENIVSVRLAVQYQIKDAKDYLFNVKQSEATLRQVTESIEREVIGRNDMGFILTEGRSQIVTEIKDEVQKAMDEYKTGLRVASVNLQDAQPPEEVQNAFEDAIRAREDKQRLINEAEAYANEVIPKARGAAARMIQEAEGYEAQVVAKSKGETERFDQLLVEYEKAPKITRKRMYLEAQEKLYSSSNKVMVTVENGNNMFYLPLNPSESKNKSDSVSISEKISQAAGQVAQAEKLKNIEKQQPVSRVSRSRL
jgi:modulator of FtsH protease HflK